MNKEDIVHSEKRFKKMKSHKRTFYVLVVALYSKTPI